MKNLNSDAKNIQVQLKKASIKVSLSEIREALLGRFDYSNEGVRCPQETIKTVVNLFTKSHKLALVKAQETPQKEVKQVMSQPAKQPSNQLALSSDEPTNQVGMELSQAFSAITMRASDWSALVQQQIDISQDLIEPEYEAQETNFQEFFSLVNDEVAKQIEYVELEDSIRKSVFEKLQAYRAHLSKQRAKTLQEVRQNELAQRAKRSAESSQKMREMFANFEAELNSRYPTI